MVSIKSSLIFIAQGLGVMGLTFAPSPTTPATSSSAYPTATTPTSSYPITSPTNCPPATLQKVNITSPAEIKAGQNFTITWQSDKPDSKKNHTEARVELWALNGGPVSSPLITFKSDRLFDTNNFTYSFPTSYVNATTKGGPVPWQLAVFVHSTYFDRNVTDLESWNLPYFGLQKVKFVN